MVRDHAVVSFDDEPVVANGGLMLPAVLAGRLGLVDLVDRWLSLGDVPGAANVGRKVESVVHAMALGADSIGDCAVLRAGQTEAVLGFAALAPPTWGTPRPPSCRRELPWAPPELGEAGQLADPLGNTFSGLRCGVYLNHCRSRPRLPAKLSEVGINPFLKQLILVEGSLLTCLGVSSGKASPDCRPVGANQNDEVRNPKGIENRREPL